MLQGGFLEVLGLTGKEGDGEETPFLHFLARTLEGGLHPAGWTLRSQSRVLL